MSFIKNCIDELNKMENDDEFKKYQNVFDIHNSFLIIGNGGSNAIASHISQDFLNKNKKSFAPTDGSLLSCFSNDFGVENVYTKFIQSFCDKNTFCILISSSGESKNIVNGVLMCEEFNIPYGVLTGFKEDNTVRTISKNSLFNYYVNSMSYGVVECVHQIFLHGVIK